MNNEIIRKHRSSKNVLLLVIVLVLSIFATSISLVVSRKEIPSDINETFFVNYRLVKGYLFYEKSLFVLEGKKEDDKSYSWQIVTFFPYTIYKDYVELKNSNMVLKFYSKYLFDGTNLFTYGGEMSL